MQEDPDEGYICNYLSVYGIMKLKTIVCDSPFLKMLFFITDFYSRVSIPSASAETSFRISCSAQKSVSIFGKKFYFVFHSEVPGTVSYVQNPENTPQVSSVSQGSHSPMFGWQRWVHPTQSFRSPLWHGMFLHLFPLQPPWPFRKGMFRENMQLSLPTPQQTFDNNSCIFSDT